MHTKERRRSYPGGTRRCQDCDGAPRRDRCRGRRVKDGVASGTMHRGSGVSRARDNGVSRARDSGASRARDSGAMYRDYGTTVTREGGPRYRDVGTTMHRERRPARRDNGVRMQQSSSIRYQEEGGTIQRESGTRQDKPVAGWCSNSELLCRVFTAYLALMLGWALPQVSSVNKV